MFEIGNSLREARERQGRTFADLENKTQIRSRYLKALEQEQFDLLPAPAYIRGFLKVYADELGLDGQLYLDEFNSRYSVSEAVGSPFRKREKRAPAQHSRRIATGAVVLSIAAIVLVSLLLFAAFTSNPPKPKVANLPQSSSAAQVKKTTVKITAVRGDAFIEVRLGGKDGRMSFGGTLVKGRSLSFRGAKIWIKTTAVQNLRWTLPGGITAGSGNRVGPATVIFTATGHKFLTG